jgi:hypothetical protein
LLEHTHLDPAVVAPLGGLIRTKPIRGQVAPSRAQAGHPKQSIEEAPTVAARTSLAFPATRHEWLHLLPLIVAQNLAVHRQLPKSQH